VRSSITIRLSSEEKTRFASLARSRGVSESTLALSAVRALGQPGPCGPVPDATQPPATDLITIRMRPGDGEAIARRASARGMKASTYLSALVRAHLADNPPLAARELAELKLSIALLAELGGFLVRLPGAHPWAARG
jgi:predicted DNA binding CopG/RHH family protein